MNARTAVLLLTFAAAGCASQPPVNVARTHADYDADRWACQQEVAQLGQRAPAARQPASYSTSCMSAGVNTQCETTANGGGGSPYADGFSSTYNSLMLGQAMPNCMRAKGWR